MKIFSSILAVSFLMSNVGLANDNHDFNEEIVTTEDDAASDMTWEEEDLRIAPAAIVGIIIGAASLGCNVAENEGEALARRDPGARRTYNNNRWYIRAGVLGALGPAGVVMLRCFEAGLNS